MVVARRAPLRERVRRAVIAALPAALLEGAWVVRTRLVSGGQHAIREFALYGDLGPTLREGGDTLRDWFVPDTDPDWSLPHRGAIALVAAAVLIMLIVLGARAARESARAGMSTVTYPDASTGMSTGPGSNASRGQPARAWRVLRACALLIACYAAISPSPVFSPILPSRSTSASSPPSCCSPRPRQRSPSPAGGARRPRTSRARRWLSR